jgi:hypothetical protein
MFVSPLMLLPHMYWRRWMEMVVAQWSPPSWRALAAADELTVCII